MSISRFRVSNLRNIAVAQLSPSSRINIIIGENGSGKTSLLEAVHILGLARSFRSARLKPIVRDGSPDFTVYGEVDGSQRFHRVGVKRDLSGGGQIRIDGATATASSSLAELLPLQLITPDSFLLLTGGPKVRRQFLDWGVFHVEHRFLSVWKQYQGVLKQRNHLLRRGKITSNELVTWDKYLVIHALEIDKFRSKYFDRLAPLFNEVLGRFALNDLDSDIRLSYYRGWDRESNYDQVLNTALDRDFASGFTHSGPHRADLRVKCGRVNAADRLSRGQQKLLVCALKLAQGALYQQVSGRKCVFLIDDLAAELDHQHRLTLCTELANMESQVFITCIEQQALAGLWSDDVKLKMFHVEHGKVSESEY